MEKETYYLISTDGMSYRITQKPRDYRILCEGDYKTCEDFMWESLKTHNSKKMYNKEKENLGNKRLNN